MGLTKSAYGSGLREVVEREYPRDASGLVAQLQDPDPSLRRRAVRDLGASHANAQALCVRLKVENDPGVREVLLTEIAQHPSELAAEALLDFLRTEDAALRNGAIEALTAMPKFVGPKISALLSDPDSDVRIFIVNLLAELKHAQVLHWLVQVLTYETQVNVVAAAIDVLAEVGGPTEVPVLKAARERFPEEAFIEFAVDLAIDRIGV